MAKPPLSSYDSRSTAITHHPTPIKETFDRLSNEEKIERIAHHFHEIMDILGLDMSNASLAKTPRRVASMYVNELFSGLDLNAFPAMSLIAEPEEVNVSDRLVMLKIGFTSYCEHHFVPMIGQAYVAYIPRGKLLGFSKFSRIVRYFARRPQLQERLTAQVADALSMVLETDDVAVSTTAVHHCVLARGIEDENSHATSQVLMGAFTQDAQLRSQFLSMMK